MSRGVAALYSRVSGLRPVNLLLDRLPPTDVKQTFMFLIRDDALAITRDEKRTCGKDSRSGGRLRSERVCVNVAVRRKDKRLLVGAERKPTGQRHNADREPAGHSVLHVPWYLTLRRYLHIVRRIMHIYIYIYIYIYIFGHNSINFYDRPQYQFIP
jgi:hypothetical protein